MIYSKPKPALRDVVIRVRKELEGTNSAAIPAFMHTPLKMNPTPAEIAASQQVYTLKGGDVNKITKLTQEAFKETLLAASAMSVRKFPEGQAPVHYASKLREVLTGGDTEITSSPWLSLHRRDDWYDFVHCAADMVAVLVFSKYKPGDNDHKGILARYENCIVNDGSQSPTALTGGIEKGEKPEVCAVREVKEEAGIDCTVEELIPLGIVYPAKFSDVQCHLFALDRTGREDEMVKPEGDGTKGEKGAYCEWVTMKTAVECSCPIVHSLIIRNSANMFHTK